MPRNKLSDLNNHLFEALEKLKDGDMDIQTAKTISDIGKNIVEIEKVKVMQARTLIAAGYDSHVPSLMTGEKTKEEE